MKTGFFVFLGMQHIPGVSRHQMRISSLEDAISSDNQVNHYSIIKNKNYKIALNYIKPRKNRSPAFARLLAIINNKNYKTLIFRKLNIQFHQFAICNRDRRHMISITGLFNQQQVHS